MKLLITGGAGFIGSALIRHLLAQGDYEVVNVDKLTYASNLESLKSVADRPGYHFERADIADRAAMDAIFQQHRPDAIMHLAAESHVDRSIDAPAAFMHTNVLGTYTLLEASLAYWRALDAAAKAAFRFHHVSTDEVYGDLGEGDGLFREDTPYAPSSPYSASKASSDHLVRAWHRTYSLPILLTNCSNNYGPYQFPEKLLPLMILNALNGRDLPVYGRGENIRDWLHVEDHVTALELVLRKGRVGESYNVGGDNQVRNLELVRTLCELLDEMAPGARGKDGCHADLIRFVADRPGHDLRYAVDFGKLNAELGWQPRYSLREGLRSTIAWYIANQDWCARARHQGYDGERLGLQQAAP